MLRLAFATAITLQKTAVLARVPLRYTATMNALPKNVSSFLPQKMYTGEQVPWQRERAMEVMEMCVCNCCSRSPSMKLQRLPARRLPCLT